VSTLTIERPTTARTADGSTSRLWGLMAEFKTPSAIFEAAGKVRDAGYRHWDCHVPFPVHGLDKQMGVKRTIIPVIVFFAGLTGCSVGFLLQAFTNATGAEWSFWAIVWVTGYPFLISGKPLLSIPSFIPVMFEITILLSALTTAGVMLLFNGLPRWNHPLLAKKRFLRASDDRFFIVIESRDGRFIRSKTEDFLKGLGAVHVEAVED